MVCSRACLRITLTARRTAHFKRARVALTNASDSSIAHIPRKKRKQIKEKAGMGERSQREWVEIQKKRARLEVRII